MVKVKPVKETVSRYTESAVLSAVRLKRYWISRGYSEAEATNKAVSQALGMIRAGDQEKLQELLVDIEEVCKILKKRTVLDCTLCPFIPSLDFYRQDEVRKEDAGGELRILNLTLTSPAGMATYHNAGGLLGSLEDIFIGLGKELLSNKAWMEMFLWHSVRDLRTSAFFAFCGRYRQAFMVLRSALELIFTGIYFQNLEDKGDRGKLENEWQQWWKKKSKSFGEGLRTSMKAGLLSKGVRKDAGRLYSDLSKAVHTLVRDEYEMIVDKDRSPARPASSFFNPEFLEEWFGILLRIIVIIREMILALHLKHTRRSRAGLDMLNNIIKILQKGKREALGFVKCPRLPRKRKGFGKVK